MHKIDYRNRNNSSLMRETSPASPRMHISEVNTAPECKSKGFSGAFLFGGPCRRKVMVLIATVYDGLPENPSSTNIFKSKAVRINLCAAFRVGVLRKERRHEKNISRRLESLTGVGKAGTVPQNVVVLLSENIKKTFLFRIYSLWTEGHQEPFQAGLPWINRVNFNNFKRI